MKSVDELFNEHIPYAMKVAYRWAAKNNQLDQLDRWENTALIGLWEACQKFDQSKNLRFSTYSLWIIRGRILDDVRSTDQTSRQDRIWHEHEYKQVSIDAPMLLDGERRTLVDKRSKEPWEELEVQDEIERIWRIIPSDRWRKILHAYFIRDLKQHEIAKEHGVSEGRINQILTKTLEELRTIA